MAEGSGVSRPVEDHEVTPDWETSTTYDFCKTCGWPARRTDSGNWVHEPKNPMEWEDRRATNDAAHDAAEGEATNPPADPSAPRQIRPLARVRDTEGVWKSRDGRWTFMRHYSDPAPQRWFAYAGRSEFPSNEGSGHTTLREVAAWADSDAGDLAYSQATTS